MEGASMEPTFKNGDQLDVVRYTSPVSRGDVIVFRSPVSPTREFLKRVIGVPGDSLVIFDDRVVIEGQVLEEPYAQGITDCLRVPSCRFDIPNAGIDRIPDPDSSPLSASPGSPQPECQTTACYFVLGDNRQNSSDSRQGWLVPVDNIIGYVREP